MQIELNGKRTGAARYSIPALFIIANKRSNFTDVRHQQTMERDRGRPLANSGIGQHIEDPAIDIAALAKAQGVESEGPLTRIGGLRSALEKLLVCSPRDVPFCLT